MCRWASLTVFSCLVVIIATSACSALLSIEIWEVHGAANAFFIDRIEDHFILTKHTLFFSHIEIFRDIAGRAIDIIPVGISGTLADVIGVE